MRAAPPPAPHVSRPPSWLAGLPLVLAALASGLAGSLSACGSDDTGGAAATTAAASSGGSVCTPGEKQPCYDGLPATEEVGTCHGGEHTCRPDGFGFGLCEGQVLPGVDVCQTEDDEDCDGTPTPACPGHSVFSLQFGGAGDEAAESVALDGSGNILLAGWFNGAELDFGSHVLAGKGGSDVFVAKLDASGAPVWATSFGADGNEASVSVAVDPTGNVYVAGRFDGAMDPGTGELSSAGGVDAFVVKLDGQGTVLWGRSFGGPGDDRVSAIAAGAGGVVVGGTFTESIDLGTGSVASAGDKDIFLVDLDASGSVLWGAARGDIAADTLHDVAMTTGGDVLIAGAFGGTLDFGESPLTAAGTEDGFLAKLTSSGALVWSSAISDGDKLQIRKVRPDSQGGLFMAGTFHGALDLGAGPVTSAGDDDLFFAHRGADGGLLWGQALAAPLPQVPTGIGVSGADDLLLAGKFGGSLDFGGPVVPANDVYDMFVAKLSAAGEHVYSDGFGDTFDQVALGLATGQDGGAVVCGTFLGSFDLGDDALVSEGLSDIFVGKLSP